MPEASPLVTLALAFGALALAVVAIVVALLDGD